jgi:hypothetical protein
VREGRENRKKSTTPCPAAEHATHEAPARVKKTPFLTSTGKNAATPGRRAAQQVPEKFQQVPDLFRRVRDLLPRAAPPAFRAPIP